MQHVDTTYLAAAEAARTLGVTSATVRLMAKRGALRIAAKTEGGIHLFDRRDVEQLRRDRESRRKNGGR